MEIAEADRTGEVARLCLADRSGERRILLRALTR